MKRAIGTLLPRLSRRAVSQSPQGSIDFADRVRINGWVRWPGSDAPITVDVLIGDQVVARNVVADLHRQDLEAAGVGNGRHGFDVTLDPGWLRSDIEAAPELTVYIRDSVSGATLLSKTLDDQLPSTPVAEESGDDDDTASVISLPEPSPAQEIKPSFRVHIDKLTTEGRLGGWSLDPAAPTTQLALEVLIDDVPYASVRNTGERKDLLRGFQTDGKGGFELQLPVRYLETGSHTVTVIAPDGTSCTKPIVAHRDHKPAELVADNLSPEGTAIVVPIYNAADDVEICIQRLLDYTDASVEVILIDDCSPDPRIATILEDASRHSRFRILRNDENLGFTRTVNRGLVESGMRDVVILNSDARVTPRWLPNMLAAARSMPRVATVTAMSDRAGAFSAPEIGNENDLPPGIDEATYARAFRRRQFGTYPVVPTGNGFCMLITRAAMQEIGLLDAEAFPRGYGEENDFCMRAMRAGWQNVIDDRTYVFHDRTKSFGTSKQANAEAGARVVNERYPEYRFMTPVYHDGEDIRLARLQARRALRDCTLPESILPRALFVVSTSSGGTPQTNLDLMSALRDSYDCWLLRCDSRVIELSHLVDGEMKLVSSHRLRRPIDPVTHRSQEYDRVVESWLVFHDFELVHIRHLAWHSLSLPALAKAHHMTVVHSFHDFYALCPTVNLLKDESFCSGACSRLQGSCKPALWAPGTMPDVNRPWIDVWRQRYGQAITHCDAFVTTSGPVRDRILAHLPGIRSDRFFVIPHGRDFRRFDGTPPAPQPGEPLRILIPGNINLNKGLAVINALMERDTENRLEFHLLGKHPAATPPHPRVVTHGPYTRADFRERVRAISPHIGAVFTIVEETWCHTLTEMWSTGLPAVVFDFPTVAGRVRESGAGWVVDHSDISALYDSLIGIMTDRDDLTRAYQAVRNWQSTEGAARTTRFMAAQYLDVYREAIAVSQGSLRPEGPRGRIAVVAPDMSPNLERSNASTHVRLWQRTHNRLDRPLDYVRMSPQALLANLATGGIDGAIIQRNAIPGPWVDRVVDAFAAAEIPYIVELDDDLLNVPADKDPAGRYAAYRPRLERLIRQAAALSISTPALRDRMAPLNDRIELIPNALSRALWAMGDIVRVPDGKIRALYMGTTTHQADLDMILPALEAVAALRPDFRLTVIGIGDGPLPSFAERIEVPGEAKNYPRFVRWLGDQRRAIDFALAPLQEMPFNDSKSDLKILDNGALGLPVVASRHPAFAHFAGREGVTLVANRVEDWTAALLDQIDNRDRHAKAGDALRRWVFENRSLESTLDDFDTFVLQACSLREPLLHKATDARAAPSPDTHAP